MYLKKYSYRFFQEKTQRTGGARKTVLSHQNKSQYQSMLPFALSVFSLPQVFCCDMLNGYVNEIKVRLTDEALSERKIVSMSLFILLVVLACSIIISKVVALAIVLLFSGIKNMEFKKDSEQWERWFQTMSVQKLTAYICVWYLIAVTITSVITYYILIACHLKYAFMIAVLFFLVRFTISAVHYHKNKEAVLEKLKKNLSK